MSWISFLSGLVAGILVTGAGIVWIAFAGTAAQNHTSAELDKKRRDLK